MTTHENKTERPEFCTDEMLVYLDELRESGETNMLGGAAYLDRDFSELWEGLGSENAPREYRSSLRARDVLMYWMKTFGERHS